MDKKNSKELLDLATKGLKASREALKSGEKLKLDIKKAQDKS